jgi:hypothetical protein
MSIKILLVTLLVSTCSGSEVGLKNTVEKVAMLKSVDQAHRKLIDLADRCSKRKCDSDGSIDEKMVSDRVEGIVGETNEPGVLFRLAVTSYVSAYPQTTGLQRVDLVFDSAWTASVNRLGSLGTPEALAALRALDDVLQTDAGDSLILKMAMERAEKSTRP